MENCVGDVNGGAVLQFGFVSERNDTVKSGSDLVERKSSR